MPVMLLERDRLIYKIDLTQKMCGGSLRGRKQDEKAPMQCCLLGIALDLFCGAWGQSRTDIPHCGEGF